jgi:hypothetical protein
MQKGSTSEIRPSKRAKRESLCHPQAKDVFKEFVDTLLVALREMERDEEALHPYSQAERPPEGGRSFLLVGYQLQPLYPPMVSVPAPRFFQYMGRSTRFVNDGPPGVVAMARVRTPPRRDRRSSR